MARYWWIPLATLALVAGSAVAAVVASGAPDALTYAASSAPAAAISPGNPMITVGHGGAGSAASATGSGANSARLAAVKSINWSGYAVHTSRYRNVSATWIEPTATCTSGKKYAAFWVGLDGYSSASVEQTGTDSDCSGKTPHYYGWYEFFPAAPVFFKTLVKPGNEMSASVTFSGTDTYTLVLRNVSRGWTHTIVKHATGLARSSAEVITEAPSSNTGVLPLADFGTVVFSSVKVSGIPIKKLNPVEIVLANNSGRDEDSTSAIASDRFHNTWIRSS
jgi:hypothetical protein